MHWLRELEFRWRSLRFGDEPVPASQAGEIFARVVGSDLVARSFSQQDSKSIRVIDADIMQMVTLQQLRGSFCLKWGVSLSFLPHRWKNGIEWHRTVKASRFDLFEAPAIASETTLREFDRITASGINGAHFFERDLRRLWGLQRNDIFTWLDDVRSLGALIDKSRAQQRDGLDWHEPHPGLVEAFALGRVGDRDGAVRALDRAIDFDRVILEPVHNLRVALEQVIAGDR